MTTAEYNEIMATRGARGLTQQVEPTTKPKVKKKNWLKLLAPKLALARVTIKPGGTAVTIPLYTCSEANQRGNPFVKANRAKVQRAVAADFVRRLNMPPIAGGVRVVMTRRGPSELDSDNLAGAFKGTRDGIADAYGVDDRDKRYDWVVAQEKAGAGVYQVRIELFPAPERARIEPTKPATEPKLF